MAKLIINQKEGYYLQDLVFVAIMGFLFWLNQFVKSQLFDLIIFCFLAIYLCFILIYIYSIVYRKQKKTIKLELTLLKDKEIIYNNVSANQIQQIKKILKK